ncbi:hypothetical protein J3R83DRAFT_3208 [Lanmaoa asiatica]|nr:hypothetical protein J3R83DRAFT_3208 [Lanmaoa asiatica]
MKLALYEKHLYPLALSSAYPQNLDKTDVHWYCGDYLYEKGDYEGAMKEYLQTIVRGSYVVRKVCPSWSERSLSALAPHATPAYIDLRTVPHRQSNPTLDADALYARTAYTRARECTAYDPTLPIPAPRWEMSL